jgi:hypothetical protein
VLGTAGDRAHAAELGQHAASTHRDAPVDMLRSANHANAREAASRPITALAFAPKLLFGGDAVATPTRA